MYGNNNALHHVGHFMAQDTRNEFQHTNHSTGHYAPSYSNDITGGYNPGGIDMAEHYEQDHHPPLASLQKQGRDTVEGKEVVEGQRSTASRKALQSPVSSTDGQDTDSSVEAEPKKSRPCSTTNTKKSGRGGRHQDEIRTIFKFENGQWFCPKCNKVVSPRATRMKAHFEKCCGVSPSVATVLNTKFAMSVRKSSDISLEDFSEESEQEATTISTVKNRTMSMGRKVENVGRQKSEVWKFYEERDGQFFCKKCGKRVSSKAHRLSQHLAKACKDTPRYIASELRKAGLSSATSASIKSASYDETRRHFDFRNSRWCCLKCGKNVSSSLEKMKKHVDTYCMVTGSLAGAAAASSSMQSTSVKSKSDSSAVNLQLAKFIYASNLPFEIVENEEFIKFVQMLRANYKLPSPVDFGEGILEDIEKEIQAEMKRNLCQKSITLIQSGWSKTTNPTFKNVKHENTIIHTIHNGKNSYFLNAKQLSEDVSSSYCVQLIELATESASSLYSCNVVGILTDHYMHSFREKIQQIYPALHVYGCSLHLVNKIGKQLTGGNVGISVTKIQTFFGKNNSPIVNDILKNTTVVVTKDDNNWSNESACVLSFIANHAKYMDLTHRCCSEIDNEVKAMLTNTELLALAQELSNVLSPLAEAYLQLQNDTSTVADAVNCWMTLINHSQINSSYKDMIQVAFNEDVSPMAIAAYLLHPVYRGQYMSTELQEIGRMWLLERNPMFVVAQTALERADTTYFPSSFLNSVVAKQMAPAVWWENAGKWQAIPEGLMDLAISLMVLPASTNVANQCSDSIGSIISAHENKLGLSKALKICNSYFSLCTS